MINQLDHDNESFLSLNLFCIEFLVFFFFKGGKDLNGAIILTIPKYTENDDISFAEQFAHLLDYLASTRR